MTAITTIPDHDQFLKEHAQVKQNLDTLNATIAQYKHSPHRFDLKCPLDILQQQRIHMSRYLDCLEMRAQFEGIDLSS